MKNRQIDFIINETKRKSTFSDFIILFFISSLLIIDFLPYFESLEIINPQFFYLSIINLLMGVYFFTKSSLISNEIYPILKRSYIFKSYTAFVFLCAISYFTARNTSLVFTKITEIIITFCLFINLSILLKNKLSLIYKIAFIISISAFFQSFQQLDDFMIIQKNASIVDLLNNMKGNTGNINILAASLTIKVPFILIAILHYTSYKRFFLISSLLSTTSVIFLTGARTPLINILFISIIYLLYSFKNSETKKAFIVKTSYLVIPILCSVTIANSIFKKSADKGRYVSLENRITQINPTDASSKVRVRFWKNTLKMAEKQPIFGIGLGNYMVESIPYERTTANDSGVSLHAHNDFLEIIAETGILNGLIYFSVFIFLFIVNLKNSIKPIDIDSNTIAILTLMILIVYGIDSFFNFPMYRPTMAIFFCLLLAFSLLNKHKPIPERKVPSEKLSRNIVIVLIVTALITGYSSFLIYKASNLEYLIAKDDINMNDIGFLNGDEVLKRMPAYPNTFSSSESFYEYAGIYYIREKQYAKALKCFSRGSKINSYSGRIDYYKHIISAHKGNIDSAYFYSKKAFNLRPRNYNMYSTFTRYASLKKDTLEILKAHQIFNQYRPMTESWIQASKTLQISGYNIKSLISFLNKGLKAFPGDSTLIMQRNDLLITNYLVEGQVYEEKSKLDKALESYKNALKIDPKNVYALQNMGFYYLNIQQFDKAIPNLENALKNPGLSGGKTEFYLAICFLNQNNKTNACKYFNLSKNKGYERAQDLIKQNCN